MDDGGGRVDTYLELIKEKVENDSVGIIGLCPGVEIIVAAVEN